MALQNLDRDYRRVAEHIFSTYYDVSGAAYDGKARGYEKLVSSVAYNKIVWGTHPKDYTDFAEKVILTSAGTSIDIGCGGACSNGGRLFAIDAARCPVGSFYRNAENCQ